MSLDPQLIYRWIGDLQTWGYPPPFKKAKFLTYKGMGIKRWEILKAAGFTEPEESTYWCVHDHSNTILNLKRMIKNYEAKLKKHKSALKKLKSKHCCSYMDKLKQKV